MAITGAGIGGEFTTLVLRIGMEMNVAQVQFRARWCCHEHPSIQTIDLVEIPRRLRTKPLLGGGACQRLALAVDLQLANARMVVTRARRYW